MGYAIRLSSTKELNVPTRSATKRLQKGVVSMNEKHRQIINRRYPKYVILPVLTATVFATLLTACGGAAPSSSTNETAAPSVSSGPADLAAAKKEGPLVIWHNNQENDIVEFLNKFTEKTGIKTEQQRILPGSALPKLEAELKSGTSSVDVWMVSDSGLMHDQMKKGRLLKYVSPEMKNYDAQYKSNPEGFYTAYFINCGPIMYNSKFVKPEDAPKTWADLLDPKWKGQIGFQDAAAGTQYAWWYLLKDVVPSDYFERIGKNQPKAYSSSTQQLQDMLNGELKIGGKVSVFQYTKAVRQGQSVKMVMPPEGVPATIEVAGIMANSKHQNAAKVFEDFLFSKEGQELWNNIQGSYSPLPDVKIKELPEITTLKLLLPKDQDDYASTTKHGEFVKLWTQITGLH
jgi:iron(III) transport system substrate-binding protein